jgi:hypothetical protein
MKTLERIDFELATISAIRVTSFPQPCLFVFICGCHFCKQKRLGRLIRGVGVHPGCGMNAKSSSWCSVGWPREKTSKSGGFGKSQFHRACFQFLGGPSQSPDFDAPAPRNQPGERDDNLHRRMRI